MAATPKIIHIVRQGGLAGLPASATVSFSSLTETQQAEIAGLLRNRSKPPSPGADRYSFNLTTDLKGTPVVLGEDTVPKWLTQLLRSDIPGIDD
ncbi:protealysin inhibitor emfourin [Devosia sp.]|uniref:protealysin inhibitor emfourin n=1 Tax=Devosia sp. TaxID=1871048 RepID=UPI003BAA4698